MNNTSKDYRGKCTKFVRSATQNGQNQLLRGLCLFCFKTYALSFSIFFNKNLQ